MVPPTEEAHQLRERGQIVTSRSACHHWLCNYIHASHLPLPASPAPCAGSSAAVSNRDCPGSDTCGWTAPKTPAAEKGCSGTALPAEEDRATQGCVSCQGRSSVPLAPKDLCYSRVVYKQTLDLHPGGRFPSLQTARAVDKWCDSDAKTPVHGITLVRKGGEEILNLLRNPAHSWERSCRERSEGFCSVLLHLCVLLPKLGWKTVSPPKNAFELLVPGLFVPAQNPRGKIYATIRKQNACKENQFSSIHFFQCQSYFLLIITVCTTRATTGLDPDCQTQR